MGGLRILVQILELILIQLNMFKDFKLDQQYSLKQDSKFGLVAQLILQLLVEPVIHQVC